MKFRSIQREHCQL